MWQYGEYLAFLLKEIPTIFDVAGNGPEHSPLSILMASNANTFIHSTIAPVMELVLSIKGELGSYVVCLKATLYLQIFSTVKL